MLEKLKPIDNQLIVELLFETRRGLIFLPENDRTTVRGRVLAVADDVDNDLMPVSIGDIIYFKAYAGYATEIDKMKVVFIHRKEILAVEKTDGEHNGEDKG